MALPDPSSSSRESEFLPSGRPGAPERLTAAGWSQVDWLWHGFSTRRGGVSLAYLPGAGESGTGPDLSRGELNLGFTPADQDDLVRENRRRFVEAVTGSSETPLVTVKQVHSDRSMVVRIGDMGWSGASIPEADGLMTNCPGVLLGIQTADCLPVLVFDTVRRVVAGFHAGWRGTVQRIVELGLAEMQREFGSRPGDLRAAIGPGIGPCCYTVGGEVEMRFRENFSYADSLFQRSQEGALHLDLAEANRRQLLAAGLDAGGIEMVGGCTGCQPERFFSHRASGGHAGRMMAVIGIQAQA